jgi:hypothetical protein
MSLPLPHTASVEAQAGQNPAGEPTFSAAITHKCRFDRITEYARGTVNEVLTDAQFIFKPDVTIKQKDKITITVASIDYVGTVVDASILDAIDGKSHHLEVRTLST